MRFSSAALKISTIATIWLGMVLTGSLLMPQYSHSAGATGRSTAQWPEASRVQRVAGQAQLILFLHPRCPCSRATLGELELLVAHCHGLFSVRVCLIQPEGMEEECAKTELWHAAAAIPGVQVNVDHEVEEARRFQAVTSGQTLLYNASGGPVFQGRITLTRNHAGDNTGRVSIELLLKQKTTLSAFAPVFGCDLGLGKNGKCTLCQS